jgi:hypothetical protein
MGTSSLRASLPLNGPIGFLAATAVPSCPQGTVPSAQPARVAAVRSLWRKRKQLLRQPCERKTARCRPRRPSEANRGVRGRPTQPGRAPAADVGALARAALDAARHNRACRHRGQPQPKRTQNTAACGSQMPSGASPAIPCRRVGSPSPTIYIAGQTASGGTCGVNGSGIVRASAEEMAGLRTADANRRLVGGSLALAREGLSGNVRHLVLQCDKAHWRPARANEVKGSTVGVPRDERAASPEEDRYYYDLDPVHQPL